MKKLLIIALLDGKVITRDLTGQKIAPIGAPANDEAYASLCTVIATQGIVDSDDTNSKLLTYIPPSQIMSIKIKFD